MEKPNTVSIWTGHFESEAQLLDYVETRYDDEDLLHSAFMTDLGIDYYDEDFFEAHFDQRASYEHVIRPLSYADQFGAKPADYLPSHNSAIAVYNYEHPGDRADIAKLVFLGSFSYQP